MSAAKKILVSGAGGPVGRHVVRLLREQGHEVIAGLRRRGGEREAILTRSGARIVTLDLHDDHAVKAALRGCDGAVFIPILSISQVAAARLAPQQQAVFISSQNVAVDVTSPVYGDLRTAEARVLNEAPQATILRPTMIYGHANDGNLADMMRAFRRAPVAPIFGAHAIQQPVFFEDLAAAAVSALTAPAGGGIFSVAGPDRLSMAGLYRAVGEAAGRKVCVINTPAAVLTPMVSLAERLGLRPPISAAQLRRAALDKAPSPSERVLTGETGLKDGLLRLARALDAPEADA